MDCRSALFLGVLAKTHLFCWRITWASMDLVHFVSSKEKKKGKRTFGCLQVS